MGFEAALIANQHIVGLSPYQPGKPIEELQRELDIQDVIKLASNENPLGPSPHVLEGLTKIIREPHFYPDGSGYQLKQTLADHWSIRPEQITLGNGSDEIFNFILKVFLQPNQAVMVSEYGFAAYAIAAKAMGAKLQIVPAKAWGHDLEGMANAINTETKVIFLANPNNPTGTYFTKAELKQFCAKVPKDVLIVVDQAYFEYMQTPEYPNALDLISQYPNVIATFTFSKAHGLAGLRVGYSVSHASIADLLNRVRLPFNVNTFALVAADISMHDKKHIQQVIRLNGDGLAFWQTALQDLGFACISNSGNFVTIDVEQDAAEVYQAMLQEGVIVRPLASYHLSSYLRISIGLPEQNQRCVTALAKVTKRG